MTAKNKLPYLPMIFICSIFVLIGGIAYALNETHLAKSKLPQGCQSCHRNHGSTGSVMLERPKDELCFKCHGAVKSGIPGEAQGDIYSIVLKRSSHPVIQTTQYHVRGESLPERLPSANRHASCYDCHNPHLSTADRAYRGTKGYSGRGQDIIHAQNEYEVCYRCHSDSDNLPPDASNIASKFEAGNASFHPVETIGKNSNMPSLTSDLSTASIITCGGCHGNDDKTGPKGPHGSIYDAILSENYSMESGAESPSAYELCYKCHRRASILDDESFAAHQRHVVFGNASCFACHDAHGNTDHKNLINFDTRIVTPNSLGELSYLEYSPGKPRCFLTCHIDTATYDHKLTGGLYCINSVCQPGW
ncbi:MAG: hypothetical protein C4560_05895 [Nitrospiraceae bacterium]|nr:MAG: hypothetical protein C4560_05895 [Nitrospiraceae bacterium]